MPELSPEEELGGKNLASRFTDSRVCQKAKQCQRAKSGHMLQIASDGALNDVPLFAPLAWSLLLGEHSRNRVNARRLEFFRPSSLLRGSVPAFQALGRDCSVCDARDTSLIGFPCRTWLLRGTAAIEAPFHSNGRICAERLQPLFFL